MDSPSSAPKLRRELNIWEAIGISLALMAPSMAANINPQGTAGVIGRAVPLAFILATIGVLLVAYGFVRLTQQLHHAGSVFGFVGVTLGPRAGVFSGLALLGTYAFYAIVTAMAAGRFGADFLRALGVFGTVDAAPRLAEFVVGFIALGLAFAFALAPVRNGTRILLIVEGVTVALILVTVLIIVVKLLGGSAPAGQTFTLDVFSLPSGIDLSTVALGAVFGFLSFAGFEAAATLGEEAKNPTRDIPRAILGVAIFGGLYFVIVTAVEVMGFGTSDSSVAAFVASGSLLGDLGRQYIATWVGDVITVGAAISAFGCCLACLVGSSRLLFAVSRDNTQMRGFAYTAKVSERYGTPSGALTVVTVVSAIVIVVWAIAFNAAAFDVFLGAGTIGTLIILVAYLMLTIGAIRFLFFSGRSVVARWEVIIPIAAIVVLGYTIFRNVWPLPDSSSPAFWYVVVTAAWLIVSIVFVYALPGLARRVGERLEQDEGLLAAKG
ncbi:MAG: APC family permease [Candidatus Limnocylindrales bacterium]